MEKGYLPHACNINNGIDFFFFIKKNFINKRRRLQREWRTRDPHYKTQEQSKTFQSLSISERETPSMKIMHFAPSKSQLPNPIPQNMLVQMSIVKCESCVPAKYTNQWHRLPTATKNENQLSLFQSQTIKGMEWN